MKPRRRLLAVVVLLACSESALEAPETGSEDALADPTDAPRSGSTDGSAAVATDGSSPTGSDAQPPSPKDAGATDSGGGTAAPPPDADTPAGHKSLAMTQDQLNRLGAGNRDIDPSALFVTVGSKDVMCSNPFRDGGGCDRWRVAFRLPPDRQRPGTWHIDDPQIGGFVSVSGPDRGGGDCWSGGGSVSYGDVRVIEVTPTTVKVELINVKMLDSFDASGTYVVPRCP